MTRRETTVESYLVEQVEKVGGACKKLYPPPRGDPDRLCSFPCGYHCLVETKWAEDADPEEHQLRRHVWWRVRGMDVFVLRSQDAVDVWFAERAWLTRS